MHTEEDVSDRDHFWYHHLSRHFSAIEDDDCGLQHEIEAKVRSKRQQSPSSSFGTDH